MITFSPEPTHRNGIPGRRRSCAFTGNQEDHIYAMEIEMDAASPTA